ncbi:hypothetical protein [Devosia sp.]|uniref:hypothetical protein n=1 Tax=Devosia sp. TaxID=1871048 RepID=UPI0027375E69|nr:hypothetical protein [Devosia sp.]MDP2779154.1 hypothetical protein [Devosia sp.]
MDINAKNEDSKLLAKRKLIKKFDQLLAETSRLRAHAEEMGKTLEREHRFSKAA